MKTSLSLVLAASLAFSGCSIFHRSPAWESVVSSRSHYSDSADAKGGYLNHLHQVLTSAGVAHKLVTYQFRYHNVYREEAVDSATAILYRDDTTPQNPWWVMDEYHHVPTWLPNWELDAQLGFFVQRPVEVLSVKEYAGGSAPEPGIAKNARPAQHSIAHSSRERNFRALFADAIPRSKAEKPARFPAAPAASDPLAATTFSGQGSADSRAAVLFRTTHGTAFDPGSSVDRAKMNELRRTLLNRSQRISLRTQ
ncbi:MAG: hypothetical protein WCF18_20045 [Chthoniobacteraceae bacterium]